MVIKVGPAPADNGTGVAWDENQCGDLVQIFISHDTSRIYSLQFQYIVDRTLVLSQLHGESIGLKFDTVKLNYPSEFITCVDGHLSSSEGINSLTFHTNKGTYGPFGSQVNNDTEFKFHTGQDNQFGGFHGTIFDGKTCNNRGIQSIGVYIKPSTAIPSLQRPNIEIIPIPIPRW